MSGRILLGALAGLLVAGGVLMIVAGLIRWVAKPTQRSRGQWAERLRGHATWARWRSLAGGIAGLLVWLLTGWPVLGLITAATAVALPMLLATSSIASRSISRVEAVEDWTRRLTDILLVGVGLEQAIVTSERTVPEPIRGEVSALAARLEARWPTELALRAFAEDLRDPTGDLVVVGLILGHRRRGPGLARALTAVAESVAEDVAMRRRVEADRAKPRATARAVTLITLAVIAIGALNSAYLAPYGTASGQLVLAGVAVAFAAALVWMRALTLSRPQPRLLADATVPMGPEP